jgi:hypothetical protein
MFDEIWVPILRYRVVLRRWSRRSAGGRPHDKRSTEDGLRSILGAVQCILREPFTGPEVQKGDCGGGGEEVVEDGTVAKEI